MGLNLIYFLVQVEGVFAISNGAELVFLVSGVHKHLFAVGKHNPRHIGVGKYLGRS